MLIFFLVKTHVLLSDGRPGDGGVMAEDNQYYVVRNKAVPEVLLKVVEAKRLLDSGKSHCSCRKQRSVSGSAAVLSINIKMIFFRSMTMPGGRPSTFVLQMDDRAGAFVGGVKDYRRVYRKIS